MNKQPRYLIELKNSKFDNETGEKVKGIKVKVAELDVPNYCKNIGATGYKIREWVEIFENDAKPKYTLDQLNEMIAKPAKALTREEKLEAEIAELRALIEGKNDPVDEEKEELKATYKELAGKDAPGNWGVKKLTAAIEELQ